MNSPLFGFLNVDKPSGVTSRWVVDQVQRLVKPAKVGHAGTLDPLASGVLVIAIGQATRLVDYVQQKPKLYRAQFLLGRTSETEDIEGAVSEIENAPIPSKAELVRAANGFLGEILQRPPAYSALKVGGQRAYALARRGRHVELAARPVTIHRLELIEYDYPQLLIEVECSSGTYIRSLGRDLAELLGTGAVMSALLRTAIGNFQVDDALDVAKLTRENIFDHLLPPRLAVEHLPAITLGNAEQELVARGQFIPADSILQCRAPGDWPGAKGKSAIHQPPLATHPDSSEFAALDACENLVAILRQRPDGQLGPVRNFRSS